MILDVDVHSLVVNQLYHNTINLRLIYHFLYLVFWILSIALSLTWCLGNLATLTFGRCAMHFYFAPKGDDLLTDLYVVIALDN